MWVATTGPRRGARPRASNRWDEHLGDLQVGRNHCCELGVVGGATGGQQLLGAPCRDMVDQRVATHGLHDGLPKLMTGNDDWIRRGSRT